MILDIIEIGYYKDGTFKGTDKDGAVYTCYVYNMDEWDKLYSHLTTPIDVEVINDRGDKLIVAI